MQQFQVSVLEQQFAVWILYFFAYAFVGWLWESSYVSVRKRRWTNSGFLIGPVVPVYGFSMMAVLAVIEPFENNVVVLYVLSALLITVIEYVTSWLMEKLFHARWWDYSQIPLNLNGRVALPISLFWGFGVVVIVKWIHPLISQVVLHLSTTYGLFAGIVLIAILMFDCGFTVANAMAFGAATKRIGDTIEAKKLELRERLADESTKLDQDRNWLEAYRNSSDETRRGLRLNYVQRRLLRSFPTLKLKETNTPANDIIKMMELLRKKQK